MSGKLDGVDIMSLPPGKYGDGNGLWLFKKNGAAGSWVIRYSVSGKLRYQGIGGIRTITLNEAREANKRWRTANLARRDLEKAEAMAAMENHFYDAVASATDGKQSGDDI